MIRSSPGATVEEIERRAAQNIAIRRIVDAQEVGYVVAFLASPKGTAITSEVIAAGGGLQRRVSVGLRHTMMEWRLMWWYERLRL